MPSTSNFDLTYNQQNVVAGGALSNPAATTGTSTGSGVTKIISGGSNVTVSPTSGVGDVTISVTSGGSGTVTEVDTGTGLTGGPITSTGTVSIANTGVTANTYGDSTHVPRIAINAQGQITSASSTAISFPTAPVTSVSGSGSGISVSPTTGSVVVSNTGVTSIVAGSNITVSPSGGTGAVTINSTAGGTGTVTSVATGTGLTGGPITTSGTISLASAYAGNGIGTVNGIAKGNGSGTITAATAGTDYVIPSGSITGTAGNITATSNSTLTTLSALSLPGSQVSGNISGNAANVTGTVAVGHGGTGITGTPTNGQIPIGNGSGYTLGTISGSGTVSVTNGTGTISINGSGISNPMTSVGDLIVGGSLGTPTRLAGNNVGTLYRLTQSGTGSASTAPIWRQDNIFNVKDYGAAGDGSTNDTTPIQNAITAAIAVNGCVYFPAGTYAYGSITDLSIVCNGSITFKGDGWRVSKLLYLGTSNALYCTISGGSYPEGNSVSIYDLAVLANAPGTGSGAPATTGVTIHYGNSFGAADEIHPNCLIDGLYIGAYIVGNYAPQYTNSGFIYGLTLNNVCQSNIQNVYLYGNSTNYDQQATAGAGGCGAGSGRALWLNNGVNNFFSNINVRFWGQGIYLDCTSGNNNQGNFFTGVNGVMNCEFFTTTGLVDSWNLVNFQCDNGDYVSGRSYPYASTFRGIVIESNFSSINPGFGGRIADGFGTIDSHFAGPCLLLNGTTGIQVSNCRFYAANSSYAGTQITGSTTNCILTNVWSQGGGSYYGVQIDSGCSGITYAMGSTHGSGTILDNGTSDIIQYNQT
jgi:Pectate lyase superfamily protein